MSIYLVEINTESKTSKVIEKDNLSKEYLCEEICNYFGFESLKHLNSEKSSKEGLHVMARQFISYFLTTELRLPHKEIQSTLDCKSITNISYNIRVIQKKLLKNTNSNHKVLIIDPYIRSYNNILKIISKFNIKNNE